MGKQIWKPGNMVYPAPPVLVSCANREGNANIITIAWTGNLCTNPPMVYISVRPSRHSYQMIEETGEFVINLTSRQLVEAADYCGVRSGRDVDKWKHCHLTPAPAAKLAHAPVIAESPVNMECRVREHMDLGSHRMYIADVLCVQADEDYLDESGRFALEKTGLVSYLHGEYYALGERLGSFGYTVRKRSRRRG